MSDSKILTSEEVGEIEARANAATKGLWKQQFISDKGYTVWAIADRGSMQVAVFGHAESFDRNNAELVAHARDDIPVLCATVRQLLAERSQWESLKSKLARHRDGVGPDVPVLQDRYDKLIAQRNELLAENEKLAHHNQLCEKAFELEDALRLPEVGNLNVLQIVKKMNALAADVARFSTLADERHDQLCTARRQRDDLAAKCAPYLETLK